MPQQYFASGAGELLQLIRQQSRTRSELLSLTGVSRTTLGARLDALDALALIRSDETADSKVGRQGGRPAEVLSFNADAGLVLVAYVGHTHTRLAVTDLNGNALSEHDEAVEIAQAPEEMLAWIEEHLDGLLAQVARSRDEVVAVGVGIPSRVEFASGRPLRPLYMTEWDRFPVAQHFRDRFGVPAFVDIDINLRTLGEHALRWKDVRDLVFVKLGTGMGAGIIAGGQIQRGMRGAAGDIAHITVPGVDYECLCGKRGCLGTVATGLALVDRLTEAGVPTGNLEQFIGHVHSNVPQAVQLVRDAGRATGSVLAAVVNLLNPQVIVIGGALCEAAEDLFAGIRESVYRHGTATATHHLQIVPSDTSGLAETVGATTMVLDQLLTPEALDRMLASADGGAGTPSRLADLVTAGR